MYNLPRLNQEQVENINRSITSDYWNSNFLKSTINNKQGPGGFKWVLPNI